MCSFRSSPLVCKRAIYEWERGDENIVVHWLLVWIVLGEDKDRMINREPRERKGHRKSQTFWRRSKILLAVILRGQNCLDDEPNNNKTRLTLYFYRSSPNLQSAILKLRHLVLSTIVQTRCRTSRIAATWSRVSALSAACSSRGTCR